MGEGRVGGGKIATAGTRTRSRGGFADTESVGEQEGAEAGAEEITGRETRATPKVGRRVPAAIRRASFSPMG